MTQRINTFQDIIDAMERDPALRAAVRRQILTDELLQMPVRVGRMEQDISVLKEDVAVLKEDVSVLKEDVTVLKENVSELKGVLAENNRRLDSLTDEVRTLSGRVGNLTGSEYEDHAAAYIHRHLRRDWGINTAIFFTSRERGRLIELLDRAETEGHITATETDDVNRADLVLTTGRDNEYIVAEVSISLQQEDIDRAERRAALLARATGGNVIPLVISSRRAEGLASRGVRGVTIEEPWE